MNMTASLIAFNLCRPLLDPAKTAVIGQRGMGQALGMSKRGDRLTVFASSKTMDEYIGRDLLERLGMALSSHIPRFPAVPKNSNWQYRTPA